MYDRQWARSIVENYQKLHARAQQVDACLQQLVVLSYDGKLLRKDIQDLLVDSLQGKCMKGFWNEYKRLVRRTPLDQKLLYRIAGKLSTEIDVEKIQRQFDFS